jgi:hypothetical protein
MSWLITTALLAGAKLQWANHPLRMAGPDNTSYVRLGPDQGAATALSFLYNLLDFSGEGNSFMMLRLLPVVPNRHVSDTLLHFCLQQDQLCRSP